MGSRAPVAFPIFDASTKALKYSTVVSERANLPFVIGGKSGSVDRESGAGKALDLIRPDPYTLGFQLLSCPLGPNGAATGPFAAVNALNVAPLAVTSGGDSDGIACVLALAHPSITVDRDLPTVFISCSIANTPGRVLGAERIEIGQVTKRAGHPADSLFAKWRTAEAFAQTDRAVLVLHSKDAAILSTVQDFDGTVIKIGRLLHRGLASVSKGHAIVARVDAGDIAKLIELVCGIKKSNSRHSLAVAFVVVALVVGVAGLWRFAVGQLKSTEFNSGVTTGQEVFSECGESARRLSSVLGPLPDGLDALAACRAAGERAGFNDAYYRSRRRATETKCGYLDAHVKNWLDALGRAMVICDPASKCASFSTLEAQGPNVLSEFCKP